MISTSLHVTRIDKNIKTKLEAWLTFLGCDDPDKIVELITTYPEFKPMYETLYQMCRNVEGVMGFFSEELRIMDQNLAQYMIEEQQKEIEENRRIVEESRKEAEASRKIIIEKDEQIKKLMEVIEGYKR